eukprot:Opistho-2@72868
MAYPKNWRRRFTVRFTKFGYASVLTLLAGCIGAPTPSVKPTPPAGSTPPAKEPAAAVPAVKARNWDDYRLTAAHRIVQANVADSFSGPLPQRLQSIPVLQVQLNRDGSVRRIEVLRTPKFAPQTVKLAMAA